MVRSILVGVAGFLLATGAARSEPYPTRPVRIIVPYAAGGSTDSTARLVADSLRARLGQNFVVENRPGAGGVVGHEAVAKADADGYTLLFSAAGPLTITPTPMRGCPTIRSRHSRRSSTWRARHSSFSPRKSCHPRT